jgi:hypothetical protein
VVVAGVLLEGWVVIVIGLHAGGKPVREMLTRIDDDRDILIRSFATPGLQVIIRNGEVLTRFALTQEAAEALFVALASEVCADE